MLGMLGIDEKQLTGALQTVATIEQRFSNIERLLMIIALQGSTEDRDYNWIRQLQADQQISNSEKQQNSNSTNSQNSHFDDDG